MAVRKTGRDKGFGDERYRVLVEKLIDARISQRTTQLALAARLGRHQQFISRYEQGERRLDAIEFVDVARALSLDPATLIAAVP